MYISHTMVYRRILLIRTGALGDFVVTLPVLRAFRDAAPSARLRLLGNPDTLALARDCADKIDSINRADWAPFFAPGGTLPAGEVDRLRDTDLALSYLPDSDGVFSDNLRRAGVQHVISYNPHPPEDGRIHIVDHLLGPVSALSIPVVHPVPRVCLAPEDHHAAEGALRKHVPSGDAAVVIHPGSGGVRKCWPPERFARVADGVAAQTGLPVLLLSGPADGHLAARVVAYARSNPVVVPCLPLRCLAALLARAAVYLGNDSGPSHLAAAVGARSVVLFGPTDARIWAPRGNAVRILRGDPSVAPDRRLQTLTESQVLDALLKQLAGARAESPP